MTSLISNSRDGAAEKAQARAALVGWAQQNGLLFAVILLVVAISLATSNFMTTSNIAVVLLQVSVTGLIAVPGAMLLLSGYVDLSVGSVGVLSAVVFGALVASGVPVGPSVVVALGVGMAWGAINGFLIAYLGFSPIVVTLAGMAGARGIAQTMTDGIPTSGFGDTFGLLGNGMFLGLALPVWVTIAVFLIGGCVWYLMPYGRYRTAIGADREAAGALGLPLNRLPLLLYMASGTAAALGGLVVASQLDSASLSIGIGQELDVLTAVLLGGVSFMGGRGSLFGVLYGVLFIGVLRNGIVLMNISPFAVDIAIGLALAFAAGLDVLSRRLERVQLTYDAVSDDTAKPAQLGSSDNVKVSK